MSVYFIRALPDGPVKIGKTADVESRLRQIQGSVPFEIALIRVIDGDCDVECFLHHHFSEHRIRGEWFDFVDEMLTIEPTDIFILKSRSRPVPAIWSWLKSEEISHFSFARMLGVSPSYIKGVCNLQLPLNKKLAQKIEKLTGGKVQPSDFYPTKDAS